MMIYECHDYNANKKTKTYDEGPTIVGEKEDTGSYLIILVMMMINERRKIVSFLLPIAMNLKRMMKKGRKRLIEIVVNDLWPMAYGP